MMTIDKHGVFVEIFEKGILLTGVSGIGKSELALELVDRGHYLIADDLVEFTVKDNELIGHCPQSLSGLIEIRGLGIINLQRLFARKVCKNKQKLFLIIHLERYTSSKFQAINRLTCAYQEQRIHAIPVAQITLPVRSDRRLALLVETAVRQAVFGEPQQQIIKRLNDIVS